MATRPLKPVGVDLNDLPTLCLYNELLLFRADSSLELMFMHPSQVMQKTLHSIADTLGLDYEYWKSLKQARISKPESEPESAGITDISTTLNPEVLDDTPGISINPQFHRWSMPSDLSSWPYGEEILDSDFDLSRRDDMPSLDNNQIPSSLEYEQQFFTPLPTPSSSSAAANEEFAAIFTDTSFFSSQRTGSQAGSKAGSGIGSRAPSRDGSAKSISSERGRKVMKSVSRSSSANRSVGFQEIVFDSNPSRPASRISGSSGRRGPLDTMARAAMKAVKRLGACWRCKWLRKNCDEESPCNTCPKGSRKSLWQCVGCRRGSLQSQMHDIPLCNPPPEKICQIPNSLPVPPLPMVFQESDQDAYLRGLREAVVKANACLYRVIVRRVTGTSLIARQCIDEDAKDSLDSFVHTISNKWKGLASIQADLISSVDHPFPAALDPLDGCILDILSVYLDNPAIKTALGAADGTSLGIFLILLRCAALYQAKLPADSDRLIAQSLICLRNSFEALCVNANGHLTDNIHSSCETTSCKVNCISNLMTSLSIFIEGLSKVFFKKENMRNKSWWLSMFYSFCIQSIVRQVLIQLSCAPGMSVSAFSGARQYLYLPLRLFNATSGLYDPLGWDLSLQPSSSSKEASLIEDVRRAKFAADQENWKALGISSSVEYLNQLFDSDGETFLSRDSGRDNILTLRRLVRL